MLTDFERDLVKRWRQGEELSKNDLRGLQHHLEFLVQGLELFEPDSVMTEAYREHLNYINLRYQNS